MPCDSMLLPQQTIQQRIAEVKRAVETLDKMLVKGTAKAVVGPQGAIAFTGWEGDARNRVTDACAFRRVMATGSALARAKIARAELLAGRTVDKKVVAQGVHSHNGGVSWHGKG